MAKSITFVVFDNFGFLDVVGPADVFTIANQRAGRTLYKIQIARLGKRHTATAESGMRLAVDLDLRQVARTHTLIVSGGNGFRKAIQNPAMADEIKRVSRRASRVVSICTGAFVLAEAGLLNKRRATTHWAYADELANSYPSVQVVPDELFVTCNKYMTSAGIAAGIDLALALLADDHGAELARQTSQRMVLYLNRAGGQSQFSERLHTQTKADDKFENLLIELATNPAARLTNSALAERLCISERHLCRLFRDRTGTSPARWLERVRVDKVREALENSSQPLEQLAGACGFASVETLRQSFRRVMGIAPTDYQKLHRFC